VRGHVDRNLIPVDLIARGEVLKVGMCVIRSADASAGVVNLVIRHNLSGTAVRTSMGTSRATS
jgi:outer membrane receptor for ferrienterochelin and colicin